MKLYDYLVANNGDYYCCDNVFDIYIKICFEISNGTGTEAHDEFCNTLYKLVDFVEAVNDCILIADWSGFIKKNYNKFKDYSNSFWIKNCDNKDDFICGWITVLRAYINEYINDEQYLWMASVLNECK